ncbi:MAG: YraN family protein [Chloroflexi bacterium]|nr:YraN family protein [Chloroflexota bacterium]
MGSKSGDRKALGALGEQIAVDHLCKRGLRVLGRNVRTRLGEIDIVAKDAETLVFVEVRTRRSGAFGTPEESITRAKRQKLVHLAEEYVQACSVPLTDYRIDVVLVELLPSGALRRLEWIGNAVEA